MFAVKMGMLKAQSSAKKRKTKSKRLDLRKIYTIASGVLMRFPGGVGVGLWGVGASFHGSRF